MARIGWNEAGSHLYEIGVDRGVLYVDGDLGVRWNGLISIDEKPTGGETTAFYANNSKYSNVSAVEEFVATITAFTYPDEFSECDGTAVVGSGVYVRQQPRKTFGLSYRTRIGNEVDVELGYKLHLVYGCLAAPSERAYASVGDSPQPINLSWDCTTTPVEVGDGLKPTAHIVIDSRNTVPQVLQIIENRLYGVGSYLPHLPTPADLLEIFTTTPGITYSISLDTVTGMSSLATGTPGDVSTTTVDGLYALTEFSHLVGGIGDGTYVWEA